MINSNETQKLKRASYVKVEDLLPNTQGHNLVVKVDSIQGCYNVKSYDFTLSTVTEVLVGDETGCILFNSRGDQTKLLKPGEPVVLRNCTIEMNKNTHMRLAVLEFGKIAAYPDKIASTPVPPSSINLKNNLSDEEYILVTEEEEKDH